MATAGIVVVSDDTGKYLKAMPEAIDKALEMVGLLAEGHVVGYMTDNYIVDTGRLRNSITHRVDSGIKCAIVGTNVEYGPYVHNGTSRMAGRPFLTDPVQAHAAEYKEVIEKSLKG